MIDKAADDQMSEQRAALHDLGQRKINGGCLTDLFAAPAGNAGTHMTQHPEPGRHIIQHFRHIITDDGIAAAADACTAAV